MLTKLNLIPLFREGRKSEIGPRAESSESDQQGSLEGLFLTNREGVGGARGTRAASSDPSPALRIRGRGMERLITPLAEDCKLKFSALGCRGQAYLDRSPQIMIIHFLFSV